MNYNHERSSEGSLRAASLASDYRRRKEAYERGAREAEARAIREVEEGRVELTDVVRLGFPIRAARMVKKVSSFATLFRRGRLKEI